RDRDPVPDDDRPGHPAMQRAGIRVGPRLVEAIGDDGFGLDLLIARSPLLVRSRQEMDEARPAEPLDGRARRDADDGRREGAGHHLDLWVGPFREWWLVETVVAGIARGDRRREGE